MSLIRELLAILHASTSQHGLSRLIISSSVSDTHHSVLHCYVVKTAHIR